MNFYEIKAQAIGHGKFPWVAEWGPLTNMPFFQRFAPATIQSKLKFWEINPRPPGITIDGGAIVWPDVLGCGGSPPPYFVSDMILHDLTSEGIPILSATEMPIIKNSSTELQNIPAPKYYVLEAFPGINYAYDIMGLILDPSGKPIVDRTKKFPESIYRLSTWNGADLFGKRAICDSTIDLLCTQRIKDLAVRNGWTNIEFKPVKVI